ncbi:HIRA-interacting protein 3 [Muntiacus reevesi]|uniref:HIRA-interacting protein 3 n=1 Tax=Muntiacus reevesi TaxID=9886 RepID=UPI003306AB0B
MARENEMQGSPVASSKAHPDLSTLTHSIVRRRFLVHAGRDHLEPEEKQALKRLVEEELLKMQVDEASAKEERLHVGKKAKRSPTPCRDPERKRFRFNSESEPSSAASSPDRLNPSAKNGMAAYVTPTEDESPNQTSKKGKKGAKSHQESEKESEEEETLTKKKENREEKEDWKATAQSSGGKRSVREERSCKQKSRAARLLGDRGDREEQMEKAAASSGDSSEEDEELLVHRQRKDRTQGEGGKRQSGSSEDGEDSPRKVKPTTGKTAKEGSISGEASDSEKEVSNSEAEGSPKERKNRSSKMSSKKGRTRSPSSSSTDGSPERKGGKAGSGRSGEDHPAVRRLKRYIRACGAHRNYKKLLGSCRSRKERLSVLRAELEALGMKGNPSLEKCRALKEQREEAAEVASLDITNIISSSGRPRRRTAWNPSGEAAPPGELYRRTLDSDEERPRPPPPDWSHLRGIISSDGESN